MTSLAPPSQAAVTEAWVHRYSNVVSNSTDQAFKVVRDAANDILVTGSTDDGIHGQDILTIKYSGVDGSVVWQKRYNGPANSDDFGTALAVDGSGNVVVTGSSVAAGAYPDFYTAKYAAADGALLWEKRYNGPVNGPDSATAVALDRSGNVVVTGSSVGSIDFGNFNNDYYTAKYAAADGALLWEQRYVGDGAADSVTAAVLDAGGNVVVAGYFYDSGADRHDYTVKYAAANGSLLWEKRDSGGGDLFTAVVVDGSGNVIVTGTSADDYYTAKYAAPDGLLLWEKGYNGMAIGGSGAEAVAVDRSGNVLVTGHSWNGTNVDYYTAKYAPADGALLWEKRYDGPRNGLDQARAVAVDQSGNVVVTGFSSGDRALAYDYDYYTAKYAAADGGLLWEKRYNSPGNGFDQADALALDQSGNVVVTGSSVGAGSAYDFYTAKYAAADGTLLWERRYNGPANGNDNSQALAVDRSDNVVVTGYSDSGAPDFFNDYYTAKYAAADGSLLWERRYNGPASPANSYDRAQAVAVDQGGNVLVTGSSVGSRSISSDYYTAKYAAADGTLLWEKRYNGPANQYDGGQAVAVDGSGNVVVTGESEGNGTSLDYYTAKYAAANGALLWERRYNGPANSYDRPRSVAVDASDNVLVTGVSYGGSSADFYTAKYAAADGALLWEKRYNGPANGNDHVGASHGLALGPNGLVVITGSSDGNFGSATTGNYVTILYRETLPPVAITLVSTGIRLRFPGVPGRNYIIERAPAVTGPWSTLATSTAPIGGITEYVDLNRPSGTAFYRTSTP